MITLYQYLIHRHLLQVDRPKVRSEGEMFSRAGFAGLIMALFSSQPLTWLKRSQVYPFGRAQVASRAYIRLDYASMYPFDTSYGVVLGLTGSTNHGMKSGKGRSRCARVLSLSNLPSLDCSPKVHFMAMNCESEWGRSLDLSVPSHFPFSSRSFAE